MGEAAAAAAAAAAAGGGGGSTEQRARGQLTTFEADGMGDIMSLMRAMCEESW